LPEHNFGGPWTEEKLSRLKRYLEAYTVILTKNPGARHLRRVYVDAFAGTGIRNSPSEDNDQRPQLLFDDDDDAQQFMKGSARVALEIKPPFHQYVFIEQDPSFAHDLENLRTTYPELSGEIVVHNGDANRILIDWAERSTWRSQRAVVFLDPYGMQVEWQTIEALAQTKAVDLWVLFPLGQGVNRLLTRGRLPPGAWAERLTTFLGTEAWRETFYRESGQINLFDDGPHYVKVASFGSIANFIVERLDSVF
jgi:three-Cys-motif partner protein